MSIAVQSKADRIDPAFTRNYQYLADGSIDCSLQRHAVIGRAVALYAERCVVHGVGPCGAGRFLICGIDCGGVVDYGGCRCA